MFSRIVTLSPQGQITIPNVIRRRYPGEKFLLEVHDEIIVLKPCNVVVKNKNLVLEKLVSTILSLTSEERSVYEVIRKAPCSTDSMVHQTSFEISKINGILTTLQFAHLVRKRKDFMFETYLPIE